MLFRSVEKLTFQKKIPSEISERAKGPNLQCQTPASGAVQDVQPWHGPGGPELSENLSGLTETAGVHHRRPQRPPG